MSAAAADRALAGAGDGFRFEERGVEIGEAFELQPRNFLRR